MSKQKAAAASLWSAADVFLRQGLQFFISVALARLLLPADFGVVALLTLFTTFSTVLVESGMSVGLIRRQESTLEEESSVFWFNLLIGGLCAALWLSIGAHVADFFAQPVLQPLMRIAAAQVVVTSLCSVQNALLTRALQFRTLMIIGAIGTMVSGAVGIALALSGFGVWALAWQTLTMASVNAAGLWMKSSWRPRFYFGRKDFRKLFDFGGSLLMSNFLEFCYNQGFSAIIGKLYGAGNLGFYNRGSGVQSMAGGIFSAIVGRVSLPLLSARTDDPAALRRAVELAITSAMLVNVPVMIGLAALSDIVIATLFGEKWLAAAPILSVLAFSGLVAPVQVVNVQCLLALGESSVCLKLQIKKQIVGLATAVIGSLFGIFGLAVSQVGFSAAALYFNTEPLGPRLKYGLVAQLETLSGIFAIGGAMGASLLVARRFFHATPPVELAVFVSLGAAVYLCAGLALRMKAFVEVAEIVASLPIWRKARGLSH